MRDSIRKKEIEKELERFAGHLGRLTRVFRLFHAEFGTIPASSAIEIQHMCLHRAAIECRDLSKDLVLKHCSSVIGHCRRAALDACKEFVFQWKVTKGLTPGQQRRLSMCRIIEVKEGFHDGYEIIIQGYLGLVDDLRSFGSQHAIIENIEDVPITGFWQKATTWLELDALISSLTQDACKPASFLQRLVESMIFKKKELGKTPEEYLADTIDLQKIYIIKCIFRQKSLSSLIIAFAKHRGQLGILKNGMQKLLANKNGPVLQVACGVNSLVFPIIAEYYALKYWQ